MDGTDEEFYNVALHIAKIIDKNKKVKWPSHFTVEMIHFTLDNAIDKLLQRENYECCNIISNYKNKLLKKDKIEQDI